MGETHPSYSSHLSYSSHPSHWSYSSHSSYPWRMSQFANTFGASEEATSAYVRSLLDLVGDRDPLAVLDELPERVERITRSVDDATLRRPEREGKWSLLHVARHLADSEIVFAFRYRMILAHDTPPITGYDQDAFAKELRYEEADLEETLEVLRVMRRGNLRLLRGLTPEQRQRAGMHSERGRESVERLMVLHAAHDLVHGRQMERISRTVS